MSNIEYLNPKQNQNPKAPNRNNVVSADLEAQIVELDEDERLEFLEAAGLSRSGLERLIHTAYNLLGLITLKSATTT